MKQSSLHRKSKHISQHSPRATANRVGPCGRKREYMKRIKEMIETAPRKKDAREMLETLRIFGNITETQYAKGREMIRKLF